MMKQDEVLIVAPSGFDGGGAATLCKQWSKLGFRTLFKDTCKEGVKPFDKAEVYKTGELLGRVKENGIKRVIVMLIIAKEIKYNYDELKSLKDNGVELFLINCDRTVNSKNGVAFIHVMNDRNDLFFDKHLFLSSKNSEYVHESFNVPTQSLNLNAYVFNDIYSSVPLKERNNYVLSLGRGEAFKGSKYYFQSLPEMMKQDITKELYWNHEGYGHKWKIVDGKVRVNGAFQHISGLSNGFPEKEQLPWLNIATDINNYEKSLKKGLVNVFSTYNQEDSIERHRHSLISVCPTMGRVYDKQKSEIETLFGPVNDINKKMRREDSRINARKYCWRDAIEYVNIELIDEYVPVLFSTDYAETFLIDNKNTMKSFVDIPTYDKYTDIPGIIEMMTKDNRTYQSYINNQRNAFEKCQDKINEEIVKVFTE